MYIKKILIEGFKSYGGRVEINDFDPHFNAITGFNGTGKSNILDAVCFVLGITQLSCVRATQLLDLVYKRGNGGVSRASVAITFDNRDPLNKPVGLENWEEFTVTRQCSVGGKARYILNGAIVQNKRITDLFCSVQLNVNNPHFLIMQGRINAVVGMRPQEVLSLLEEAAGTKIYETKKNLAKKTIERKEIKLRELEAVIEEDLKPRLQRLQDQQRQYQQYQQTTRELESLQRVLVAYTYMLAERNMQVARQEHAAIENTIAKLQSKIAANITKMGELDVQINEINSQMDVDGGASVSSLQEAVIEAERCEEVAKAEVRALKDSIKDIDNKITNLDQSRQEEGRTLDDRMRHLRKAEEEFERLRGPFESAKEAVERAQATVAAVASGRDDDGGQGSLRARLIDAEAARDALSTRIDQKRIELRGVEESLRSCSAAIQGQAGRMAQDKKTTAELQEALDVLRVEMESVSEVDPSRLRSLQEQFASTRQKWNSVSSHLANREVDFSNPQPGFDRSRVKGYFWKLVELTDDTFTLPLSIAAGGKVNGLVVDTAEVATLLLEKKCFQRRVTMIPLDKVQGHCIDPNRLRLAQRTFGADRVRHSMDLVSYDPYLTPAVKYVFGSTVICSDVELAKILAYDSRFRMHAVAMNGQSYEPSGVTTGGRSKYIGELAMFKEMKTHSANMTELQGQIDELKTNRARYADVSNRYENTQRRLESTRAAVARCGLAEMEAKIGRLREQRDTYNDDIARDTRALQEATAKVNEARLQATNLDGRERDRDRDLERAQKHLTESRRAAANLKEQWDRVERRLMTLRMETSEYERGARGANEQYDALRANSEEQKGKLPEVLRAEKEAKERTRQARAESDEYRRRMAERNSDTARLMKEKDALAKRNTEMELKIKSERIRSRDKEARAVKEEEQRDALLRSNSWIESEREQFGVAGGPFDFSSVEEVQERVGRLTEERERLSRGLNHRAHTLLGKEVDEFNTLTRKKDIVTRDRDKLYRVIYDLDIKMTRFVRQACVKVAAQFSSVFETLLPGACARLQMIDGERDEASGETPVAGLEMHVGFNGIWKKSLAELSGGQRSLVAMALVLSLLLFRPAPLYILDEVDAALDLAHTQNIGQMLRRHFRQSQFVVVSLKDGMFNNADVLFRTQLVNGMSAVERFIGNRGA